MEFFRKIKELPAGTVYYTELEAAMDFGQWLEEFSQLLAQQRPFATVCAPMPQAKGEEQRLRDRRRYMDWLFQHQEELRQYCAAMLLFEVEPEIFRVIREKSAKLAQSLRLPYLVVASEHEALERAAAALNQFKISP